jgi:hypothetical protein
MIERSLGFGMNNGLIGTLCIPEQSDCSGMTATAGIILFNAGIVHRIGPQRINVHLARDLAKAGIPSIRFDLGGVGDSARAAGETGFEDQAVADIQAAMTTLGEATGLRRFGLFGFCSGAFHSYNAAQIDKRVIGVMLYEAYRYQTVKANLIRLSLRIQRYGLTQTITQYATKALHCVFRKLHPLRIAKPSVKEPGVGFIVDSTSKASFAKGVRLLLERGVNVSMLYAGSGFAVYSYPRQFKDAFKNLGIADEVSTTFLPDIDHMATGKAAQSALVQQVLAWAAKIAGVVSIRNVQGQYALGAESPQQPSMTGREAQPESIVLGRN